MSEQGMRVTREKNERALDLPSYLYRIVPAWQQPIWYQGEAWRTIVRRQPFAMDYRDTLIGYVTALDWRVIARDPNERDERKKEVDYYTKLLEGSGYDNGLDYVGHVEKLLQDVLDLPFGGASEVGREGDSPEGKVLWIHNIDGATLFPTWDHAFPMGQKVNSAPDQMVFFPRHSVARIYMTPRPEIQREGWGMAPPEKIFLALEMLWRGDQYYANLLLDTPTAGILDLGDMEKSSALEWLDSWRTMMSGVDPFKIPVLYEHTNKIDFVPFGKPPTDIMYDKVTMRYAALVGAGYGLTLSDLGLSSSSNGGETLAGSIRDERRTRTSGVATVKKKTTSYFNSILPEHLKFVLIDNNDEVSVTTSRARLANAQANKILIETGQFTADELRQQAIADGLITVPVPEKAPEPPPVAMTPGKAPDQRDTIGRKVPPSQGGQGEIKQEKSAVDRMNIQSWLDLELSKVYSNLRSDVVYRKLIRAVAPKVEMLINRSMAMDDMQAVTEWYERVLFQEESDVPELVTLALDNIEQDLDNLLEKEDWWKVREGNNKELEEALLAAYIAAVQEMSIQMQEALYEENLSELPGIPSYTTITNEEALAALAAYIATVYDSINEGTKYYIRKAVIASIRAKLSELSEENIDINQLVNDNMFVSSVITDLRSRLGVIMKRRSGVISEYENTTVSRMGQLDLLKRSGLQLKKWDTFGPNPCEHCIWNEAQGFVPLNFVYRASFPEGVLQPLAHGYCHCGLSFDRDELITRAQDGMFKIWLGD